MQTETHFLILLAICCNLSSRLAMCKRGTSPALCCISQGICRAAEAPSGLKNLWVMSGPEVQLHSTSHLHFRTPNSMDFGVGRLTRFWLILSVKSCSMPVTRASTLSWSGLLLSMPLAASSKSDACHSTSRVLAIRVSFDWEKRVRQSLRHIECAKRHHMTSGAAFSSCIRSVQSKLACGILFAPWAKRTLHWDICSYSPTFVEFHSPKKSIFKIVVTRVGSFGYNSNWSRCRSARFPKA